MAEYFAMGGYAAYIWPAYGVTLGILLVLAVQGVRRYRRNRAQLETMQADREARP